MSTKQCCICVQLIADNAQVVVCKDNHCAHSRCHTMIVANQIMQGNCAITLSQMLRCSICRTAVFPCDTDAQLQAICNQVDDRIKENEAETNTIEFNIAIAQAEIDRTNAVIRAFMAARHDAVTAINDIDMDLADLDLSQIEIL